MKTCLHIPLLTLAVFLLNPIIPNLAIAQNAREIIQKMEDRMRGDEVYMEVTMEIVRPRYSRSMSMKSWALGEDYSLILVTAPARDRGVAYLKREREIWNWMPTIDRLIKLPPSMMAQSWMGSDFTNDDLVRESSTINDYEHRLIGEGEIDGYSCYKIEMIPKPDAAIVWGKVLVWVSTEHYFQMRGEQYDERMELVNTIVFSDVKNLGGREIPAKMELVPEDKQGHRTVLVQEKVDFNPGLDVSFFSIQNLQQVR